MIPAQDEAVLVRHVQIPQDAMEKLRAVVQREQIVVTDFEIDR